MVLIEAIRQMFIAVVEKYFSAENKSYVIFNDLNVEFEHFVFPFKVQIKQKIMNVIKKKGGAILYESKFEVSQLERVVLSAESSYTVYDKSYIDKKEKEIAEKTTSQLVELF